MPTTSRARSLNAVGSTVGRAKGRLSSIDSLISRRRAFHITSCGIGAGIHTAISPALRGRKPCRILPLLASLGGISMKPIPGCFR